MTGVGDPSDRQVLDQHIEPVELGSHQPHGLLGRTAGAVVAHLTDER